MKMVLKIARTELRTLFYSPIAWFLMIVFLIQCGLAYTNALNIIARTQELGGQGLEYLSRLTQRAFASQGGVFSSVMQNLYLYIPLLTMGLISREVNTGTIKLLYSSPVNVREIVFGKYLSMMIYSLLLVLIVGIFMVMGLFNIKSPDTGILLSAALGFYLLLCAYSAIGLFMSCLTTYQVVAAVCTFIMIGILTYIGDLWQGIDFIRDLTYFLSLSGRTEHMLTGLITTKDVMYFAIIVYIFLGLSICKLKAGRESRSGLVVAGRYTVVVVTALLIGYISSRPRLIGYYDATANKINTLTPNAQHIIKELGDEPVEVTAYNNLLSRMNYFGLPQERNWYLSHWESYQRFKHDFRFNFVNYYDSSYDDQYLLKSYPGKTLTEVAKKYAKASEHDLSKFIPPAAIRQIIDLRPERNRFVMQLKYKGRTTFLRVFDDQRVWPGETEVSAAFKRLLQAKLPRVGFLTGNLERNIGKMGDRDYKGLTSLTTFRYALVNQGFDVDTISLQTQVIPGDLSMLVIADPKTPLDTGTLARIHQYIGQGGNLLIAGEPGKQSILNPLLEQLGVQLLDGAIVQPSPELSPDLVLADLTETAAGFSKRMGKGRTDSTKVSMPGVTGLSYGRTSAFEVRPLLMTDGQRSWLKKGKLVADSAALIFSPQQGDERGSFPMALSLTRNIHGKEQRIVVTGDADFMSNIELNRYNVRTANFVFNTSLFSWLDYGDFPIDTSRPDAADIRVNVTVDQVAMLKVVCIWVLPGILLLGATVLLVRRKRK